MDSDCQPWDAEDCYQQGMKPPEDGGLVADHLVYRYNVGQTDDGLAGSESTFNICTFWLVEALTRAGRFEQHRLEEGRLMFERMAPSWPCPPSAALPPG